MAWQWVLCRGDRTIPINFTLFVRFDTLHISSQWHLRLLVSLTVFRLDIQKHWIYHICLTLCFSWRQVYELFRCWVTVFRRDRIMVKYDFQFQSLFLSQILFIRLNTKKKQWIYSRLTGTSMFMSRTVNFETFLIIEWKDYSDFSIINKAK